MRQSTAPRMRVRFTAEIDYEMKIRGEGIPVEEDPGSWDGFDEADVRRALERVLRWPELSLAAGADAGRDRRSKWSPTDHYDPACRKTEHGRVVHVDDCGCTDAVVVVDVEIDRERTLLR